MRSAETSRGGKDPVDSPSHEADGQDASEPVGLEHLPEFVEEVRRGVDLLPSLFGGLHLRCKPHRERVSFSWQIPAKEEASNAPLALMKPEDSGRTALTIAANT